MESRRRTPAERLDEREVLELIATCQSNSAIAVRLFVAPKHGQVLRQHHLPPARRAES